jgi:hypothetical protein
MKSSYHEMLHFMEEYFPAYSLYGQIEETHHVMISFTPEVTFDDGLITGAINGTSLLAHPAIQDNCGYTSIVDEKQKEVGALLKTQAIDRATGNVLLELKMNVLYSLKIDQNGDLKITKVRVFLESNPDKVAKLAIIYGMGGKR